MGQVLDLDLEVSESKLEAQYYVHFWSNVKLGKI